MTGRGTSVAHTIPLLCMSAREAMKLKPLWRIGQTILVCMVSLEAAPAHAETSVVLYGLVDMGVSFQTNSPNRAGTYSGDSKFGLVSGGQSGSRIGLRGGEDLGGGVQASFVLENGFESGDGKLSQGKRLFGRQAWLGLQSASLGYLRFGRQYNFSYDSAGVLSPFGAGDFARATMGGSYGSGGIERLSNMVKLETASLLGFKAGVGYAFSTQMHSIYTQNGNLPVTPGESANYNFTTGDNLRAVTAGVLYSKGPTYLAAAYEVFMPNMATADNQVANATSWIVGGMYDFGGFKLSAAYGQTRNGWFNPLEPTENLDTISFDSKGKNTSFIFDSNVSVNSYQVGFIFPASDVSQVFGIWHMVAPSGSMQANSAFAIATQSVFSLGYTYNFTKRTNFYAYSAYGTNYALIDGLTSATIGVGIRHKF